MIAKAIIEVIESSTESITIGVHGDWGAGKSSILAMIEGILDEDEEILGLRFNSWRYQGFEDSKLAMMEAILTSLTEQPDEKFQKEVGRLKSIVRRIDVMKVAKAGGSLAFNLLTGMPSPEQISSIRSIYQSLKGKDKSEELQKELEAKLEEALGGEEADSLIESLHQFQKGFAELIESSDFSKLVILVDDLDRCLPETVIDTLEVIRLFLFTDKTAFILASDEELIEYSVRAHFPELPKSQGHISYPRSYLEKLIQVPFRIPNLGQFESKIYLLLLLLQRELGKNSPKFKEVVEECLAMMTEPWIDQELSYTRIQKIVRETDKIKEAYILSKSIGDILANGTNGNPRQIKRFLNTLLLRKRIAEIRGFGDQIDIQILAKLMITEQFIPNLYRTIIESSNSNTEGFSSIIEQLEEVSETEKEEEEELEIEDPTALSLMENPQVNTWLKIEPRLSQIDLRPYTFIARDGKQRLDQLARFDYDELINSLKGPRLSVVMLRNRVNDLRSNEREMIVTRLIDEIVSLEKLTTLPPGVEGLKLICEIETRFKDHSLEMLENFSAVDLGPWVLKFINDLKFEDQKRVDGLKAKWRENTDNRALKKALEPFKKKAKRAKKSGN